jgi:hypothetical protein
MFFSALRSTRPNTKHPTTSRLNLESLGERVNPASPHFISATSSIAADGDLVISFKEAGLGDTVLIDYTVTGDGSGQYQWFNKGGNKPQGQPFQTDPVAVSGSGSFASGRNGQVTGTIVCEGSVPPPPQDFLDANHASNWVAKLTVTYDSIVLTDTTDGVSITVPDATATVVVLV